LRLASHLYYRYILYDSYSNGRREPPPAPFYRISKSSLYCFGPRYKDFKNNHHCDCDCDCDYRPSDLYAKSSKLCTPFCQFSFPSPRPSAAPFQVQVSSGKRLENPYVLVHLIKIPTYSITKHNFFFGRRTFQSALHFSDAQSVRSRARPWSPCSIFSRRVPTTSQFMTSIKAAEQQ
jgi:hypothetical protein